MTKSPDQPLTFISDPILITKYDKAKVKQPFAAIPVAEHLFGWIGKLTLTWSEFEREMDDIIRALLKVATINARDDWNTALSFKRRRKLCRHAAIKVWGDYPVVLAIFTRILDDAVDLHWRRNFIVHAKLKCVLHAPTLPSKKIVSRIHFDGRHNGKQVTLTYDEEGLERLFYGIGNLLGRIRQFKMPDPTIPGLSSDDISHLRDFFRPNHPNPATTDKPENQPRSS